MRNNKGPGDLGPCFGTPSPRVYLAQELKLAVMNAQAVFPYPLPV